MVCRAGVEASSRLLVTCSVSKPRDHTKPPPAARKTESTQPPWQNRKTGRQQTDVDCNLLVGGSRKLPGIFFFADETVLHTPLFPDVALCDNPFLLSIFHMYCL